jgi:hypothetical protein
MTLEEGSQMRSLLVIVGAGLCFLNATPLLKNTEAKASALPESGISREARANRRMRQIDNLERPLLQARETLKECGQVACLTPSEAAAVAFSAGPDRTTPGRFILDVRAGTGPGNRHQSLDEDLFYLASERNFRQFGVVVLAIEPQALEGLLNLESKGAYAASASQVSTNGTGVDHQLKRASTGEMMKRFGKKRLVVDGEIGLQFIEYVDWETNSRNGDGFYQVWVRVNSHKQIMVIDDD